VARPTEEERAWLEGVYESAVSDPTIKTLAWRMAEEAWDGEPGLNHMDLVASRAYLRACLLRFTVAEVSAMLPTDFAGLWARGCVGACEYRLRRRPKTAAREPEMR